MALISFPRTFGPLTTALMSYLDDNFTAINTAFGVATGASQTPGATTIPIAGSDGRLPYGWAGLIGRQTINVGVGTYTPTAGTHSVLVYAIGGGGGGGGTNATGAGQNAAGGGGGSGGLSVRFFFNIGAGPFTCSVGTNGIGTAGSGGTNGVASSITIGAVTLQSGYGAGGVVGAAMAGPGISGQQGGAVQGTNYDWQSIPLAFSGVVYAVGNMKGGDGAGGLFGYAGAGGFSTGPGAAAGGYGCGGGGATALASTGIQTGGNGSPGALIIWEFA